MKQISQSELDAAVASHGDWLKGDGGERLNLAGADLTHIDLARYDLTGAIFTGADMAYVNMAYTNLTRTELADTNLAYVNMAYARLVSTRLAGANLFRVSLDRSSVDACNRIMSVSIDGHYGVYAYEQNGELFITSGCRRGMTLETARQHWAPERVRHWSHSNRKWGERRLRAVEFLADEARIKGWIK